MGFCKFVISSVSRKKCRYSYRESKGSLSKCLTTFDLINLGVGAVLGAGTYVVAGQVAADMAGPSVVLSFLIAAFASLLSGLCYAEFGSRVPNTPGGAYSYSYVAVGEIWAFIIGWNLILEYMIGTAADASALSASIENLFNAVFGDVSRLFAPFDPLITETRPDVVSLLLTIFITILLAMGVKNSARFGNVCNVINIIVILFTIVVGSYYSRPERWFSSYAAFFPFGIGGMMSGAASCFYAFVGFDIIATTGEEAANPSRSIPRAIVITLVIVLVGYVGISTVITMMVPYYQLNNRAPVAIAFSLVGLHWANHFINLGAIFGLSSSLLGSMFPLPRIVYSMASDGLFCEVFTQVSSVTNIPILATIIPGVVTALFSFFFELHELVEMMSIGTLLAYTLVSVCVLILRYDYFEMSARMSERGTLYYECVSQDDEEQWLSIIYEKQPTVNTFKAAMCCLWLIIMITVINGLIIIFLVDLAGLSAIFYGALFEAQNRQLALSVRVRSAFSQMSVIDYFGVVFVFFSSLLGMSTFYLLSRLPQSVIKPEFQAPLVPFLPVTGVIFNIFLMLKLGKVTWLRFFVWLFLGFCIYFGYSIKNSKECAGRKNLTDRGLPQSVDQRELG